VSQSKIVSPANFRFFTVVLLTSIACGVSSSRSEAISPSGAFEHHLSSLENGSTPDDGKHNHSLLQEGRTEKAEIPGQNTRRNLAVLSSPQQQPANEPLNVLLADNPDNPASDSAQEKSSPGFMRQLSLLFLLLFFVPLGIFYPLFLFYRMLLVKPDESEDILNSDRQEEFPEAIDPVEPVPPTTVDLNQTDKATVSKLQIAFSPPASQLREELSRVGGVTHLNEDYDLVDLMHQTVAVLIEQEHWTHISYDSIALPLEKVESEFDFISHQERNKFTEKTPSLINYNRNVSSSSGYQEGYSYVVVTLILCTSHTAPLFQSINTKQQLVEELTKLSRMKKDSVLKFELLWNPQQDDVYISNEQLLIEYSDMTRLF
jgi:flagellar basal body-associated protein FliL